MQIKIPQHKPALLPLSKYEYGLLSARIKRLARKNSLFIVNCTATEIELLANCRIESYCTLALPLCLEQYPEPYVMGCYRVIIKSHLCNGAHCRACKSNEYSTHQTDATLAISILSFSSIIIIFHGYATIYLRVICHGCFTTYIGAWQCLHNDEALILD